MKNQLLDLETEFNLRRLAPKIGNFTPFDARLLLCELKNQSTGANQRMGLDDKPYYMISLADMIPNLNESMTPKRVGALCRALCLEMRRKTPGYAVAWNEEQLDILNARFKAYE